jgi:hypothetical protein
MAVPQLKLHRARVLLAQGDARRAETCIRNAIGEAQAQQAQTIEMKARGALAGLNGPAAPVTTETRP